MENENPQTETVKIALDSTARDEAVAFAAGVMEGRDECYRELRAFVSGFSLACLLAFIFAVCFGDRR